MENSHLDSFKTQLSASFPGLSKAFEWPSFTAYSLSPFVCTLPASVLLEVERCIKGIYTLSQDPDFQSRSFSDKPAIASFNPGHDSVFMAYDFMMTSKGPQLLEINTNAGGFSLSYLQNAFSQQPHSISWTPDTLFLDLKAMFLNEFSLYAPTQFLRTIAIMDETPQDQALYFEFLAFKALLEAWGFTVVIVSPEDLKLDPNTKQMLTSEGLKIDLIYNRHCDFYLETEALLAVKTAYLNRTVCLTPNPFTYGLLADKRQLISFSQLNIPECHDLIPKTVLMSDLDKALLLQTRKSYFFKPIQSYGSKGAYSGAKLSQVMFEKLDPATTIVQPLLVSEKYTPVPDGPAFNQELRVYAYQDRILSLAMRLYRGQTNNAQTLGGGIAALRVID